MEVKDTCVARGVSPFIKKASVSLIPSPIVKAGASPFIMKAGASPILYKVRRVLEWCVSILYPPYEARFQLG
jgi:hypothetical protein